MQVGMGRGRVLTLVGYDLCPGVYFTESCSGGDDGPGGLLGCYLVILLGVICDMGSRKTPLDAMVVGVGVLERNHLNYSFLPGE